MTKVRSHNESSCRRWHCLVSPGNMESGSESRDAFLSRTSKYLCHWESRPIIDTLFLCEGLPSRHITRRMPSSPSSPHACHRPPVLGWRLRHSCIERVTQRVASYPVPAAGRKLKGPVGSFDFLRRALKYQLVLRIP